MNLEQIEPKELFFPVTSEPLKAIVGNTAIQEITDYRLFHHDKNFLGIQPIDKQFEEVFYVEHKLILECGKALAESLELNLDRTLAYTDERKSTSFFILGKDGAERLIPLPSWEKLDAYGFSPAIVVENGFNYLDKIRFYLLVETRISPFESGFLTIAKYKFDRSLIKKCLDSSEDKKQLLINEIRTQAPFDFDFELNRFLHKYEQLHQIETNPIELTAVALDIFNRNRNVQSLRSDDRLRDELHKFIERAETYFRKADKMSSLVQFITRYHSIGLMFSHLSINKLQDVLTEKNAYKNLERVYDGKNQDIKERSIYIDAQVKAMENVMSF